MFKSLLKILRRNGSPLYSCLRILTDESLEAIGPWGHKSQTWLRDFIFHFHAFERLSKRFSLFSIFTTFPPDHQYLKQELPDKASRNKILTLPMCRLSRRLILASFVSYMFYDADIAGQNSCFVVIRLTKDFRLSFY